MTGTIETRWPTLRALRGESPAALAILVALALPTSLAMPVALAIAASARAQEVEPPRHETTGSRRASTSSAGNRTTVSSWSATTASS